MTEIENEILNAIISCEICTYTCCYAPPRAVVPIGNLATLLNYSRYNLRKSLKELIAAGYIEYTSQGRPAIESNTENGHELICEQLPPINGYALTTRGYASEQFKGALEEFNRSMEELANGYDMQKESEGEK